MKHPLATLALICFGLASCASPVGVRETGFEPVYRSMRENVLDEGSLSAGSRMALEYFGLGHRYRDEPEAVIDEMEAISARERIRPIEVAIAELHYDLALARRDRDRFLECALHAYFYLFSDEFEGEASPYSPHFRLACDLYNRGLARALLLPEGAVELSGGDFQLPSGAISVRATRPGFPWDEKAFSTFLPADRFEVRGLRERVRGHGLGVPLIAIRSEGVLSGIAAKRIAGSAELPATAFLRVHGGPEELRAGTLTADLELHLSIDVQAIEIAGARIPLEADFTAPIAHMLEESQIWSFGLRGFLRGRLEDFPTTVGMLQPYQEGKVPLVLIHGTASSPAAWAQTINGLVADPRIRDKYQVWLVLYNTGNPIAYSAALVRRELEKMYAEVRSETDDPVVSKMVLVGHSQGGLVTRLLVTEGGDRIWERLIDQPFESYELEPETRELLEDLIYFEPLPFVERAVFISTPHRGSYIAGGWIGRMSAKLVHLPGKLVGRMKSLLSHSDLPEELRELKTSVDNMDPDSTFVQILEDLPFGEGIQLHSIIPVTTRREDVRDGKDGVVKYSSAHLEGVESEFVVRGSGHSCQGDPATIGELRRILFEHILEDVEESR